MKRNKANDFYQSGSPKMFKRPTLVLILFKSIETNWYCRMVRIHADRIYAHNVNELFLFQKIYKEDMVVKAKSELYKIGFQVLYY